MKMINNIARGDGEKWRGVGRCRTAHTAVLWLLLVHAPLQLVVCHLLADSHEACPVIHALRLELIAHGAGVLHNGFEQRQPFTDRQHLLQLCIVLDHDNLRTRVLADVLDGLRQAGCVCKGKCGEKKAGKVWGGLGLPEVATMGGCHSKNGAGTPRAARACRVGPGASMAGAVRMACVMGGVCVLCVLERRRLEEIGGRRVRRREEEEWVLQETRQQQTNTATYKRPPRTRRP